MLNFKLSKLAILFLFVAAPVSWSAPAAATNITVRWPQTNFVAGQIAHIPCSFTNISLVSNRRADFFFIVNPFTNNPISGISSVTLGNLSLAPVYSASAPPLNYCSYNYSGSMLIVRLATNQSLTNAQRLKFYVDQQMPSKTTNRVYSSYFSNESPVRGKANCRISSSSNIYVIPEKLGSFSITNSVTSVIAGDSLGSGNIRIIAFDIYGNIKTDFTNMCWLTSSLSNRINKPFKLNKGVTNFPGTNIRLYKTGTTTIKVSTNSNSGISACSGIISVLPGTPSHFGLSNSGYPVCGFPFRIRITNVWDNYGNAVDGTAHISITNSLVSPDGFQPMILTNFSVNNGVGETLLVIFKAMTNLQVQVHIGTFSTQCFFSKIQSAPVSSLTLTNLSTVSYVTLNSMFPSMLQVKFQDDYGNGMNHGTNIFWFRSSDLGALLPYSNSKQCTNLGSGVSNFTGSRFKMVTPGTQYLTVVNCQSLSNRIGPFIVCTGSVSNFNSYAPPNVTAGIPFNLWISNAKDMYDNPVDGVCKVYAEAIGGLLSPNGTSPTNPLSISVKEGRGTNNWTLYRSMTNLSLRFVYDSKSNIANINTINCGAFGKVSVTNTSLVSIVTMKRFPPGKLQVALSDIYGNGFRPLSSSNKIWFDMGGIRDYCNYSNQSSPLSTIAATNMLDWTNFHFRSRGWQKIVATSSNKSATNLYWVTNGSAFSFQFRKNSYTNIIAGSNYRIAITNAVDRYTNMVNGYCNITNITGLSNLFAPDGAYPRLPQVKLVEGCGTNSFSIFKAVNSCVTLCVMSGNIKSNLLVNRILPNLPFSMGLYTNTNLTAMNNPVTVQTGQRINFIAVLYDRNKNRKSESFHCNWYLTSGLGEFKNGVSGTNANTLFIGKVTGREGKVHIVCSNYPWITKDSEIIKVGGRLFSVKIVPFSTGSKTVAASEQLRKVLEFKIKNESFFYTNMMKGFAPDIYCYDGFEWNKQNIGYLFNKLELKEGNQVQISQNIGPGTASSFFFINSNRFDQLQEKIFTLNGSLIPNIPTDVKGFKIGFFNDSRQNVFFHPFSGSNISYSLMETDGSGGLTR